MKRSFCILPYILLYTAVYQESQSPHPSERVRGQKSSITPSLPHPSPVGEEWGIALIGALLSYFAHVLIRRGVYSRAAFISLSASNCAAFIRGRRLFEGGVYSRKYGTFCLIVHCHCSLAQITETNQITAWYG